jgi:hypothetical protein
VTEQTLQARAARLAETHFLGGPTWIFERVGRHGLEVLLEEGVTPRPAGAAQHSLRWIIPEAARHGLSVRLTPYRVIHHQYRLRISR